MALFLRGKVWHTVFYVAGEQYRRSTRQTNEKKAERVESLLMAKVESLGSTGLRKKAPLLRDFLPRFTDYNKSRVDIEKKTKAYYSSGVKLLEKSTLASMYIDRIKPVTLQSVSFGNSASNENMGRRTLSKLLSYAVDIGVLAQTIKIPMLEEHGRDVLIDPESEKKILALEWEPLSDILIIAQDAGMRPGEVLGMRVEYVRFDHKHYQNPHGKTRQARRKCGISERMVPVLRTLIADRSEGWLFPYPKNECGHVSIFQLDKQFAAARELLKLPSNMVMYCARHTWATEVGQHVGLAELKQAGGWSDAKVAMRYQHPGAERVLEAVNQRNKNLVM